MLDIERTKDGIKVRVVSGTLHGQVVARADSADIVGPYHNCKFKRVWGLEVLNDKVHFDPRLLRAMAVFGGHR
jgi:hypothetical protein